jgi:hypothetical protein
MKGSPMTIHINRKIEGYKPLKLCTARKVPTHFQKAADRTLKWFLDSGVLTPVSEPTEWCSPGFFVPKNEGEVRLVSDYKELNKYTDRPVHPFTCTRDALRGILSDSAFFIKLDAVSGYYQIPLDRESSFLTTFLLPSGRYRFTRAPMGLNSSSDEFNYRTDCALQAVPDLVKIVDDSVIQGPSEAQCIPKLRVYLQSCRDHNLTISKRKLEFGDTIKFAGHIVSKNGVTPDPAKTAALAKFPVPKDLTELRSFLGLANQLGWFCPDLAHMSEPLRGLLKKNVAYLWLPEHQIAFDKMRKLLTSKMIVRPFNNTLRTELLTDASRLKGLGYALLQYDGDQNHLVQCGSRSLNSAERNYATNELEALAIQWAVQDCQYYLLGSKFTVVTDHKPLVGTFEKQLTEITNERLVRFREKLSHFRFNVMWTPGKTHHIADALSRAPIFDAPEVEEEKATLCCVSTDSSEEQLAPLDPQITKLMAKGSSDEQYLELIQALLNGKNVSNLPPTHPGRRYSSLWDQLSLYSNKEGRLVVLDGHRIIPPASARSDILALLHAPHAGVSRTRRLAKGYFFWPKINEDIRVMIEGCQKCQELRPSQSEELSPRPMVEAPMDALAADLFEVKGKHYLAVVDRYSGWPWVFDLVKLDTNSVTSRLQNTFLDFGFPSDILTDGGPQFRGPFTEYCSEHGINHSLSSPYNPQSNGLAEMTVKSMSHLMQKCSSFIQFRTALLTWRNVPRQDSEFSPAQLFFGLPQRCGLPQIPRMAYADVKDKRGLPVLEAGTRVRLQEPLTKKWKQMGTVRSVRAAGRSYYVQTDDGQTYMRNRRFLKLVRSGYASSKQTMEELSRLAVQRSAKEDGGKPSTAGPIEVIQKEAAELPQITPSHSVQLPAPLPVYLARQPLPTSKFCPSAHRGSLTDKVKNIPISQESQCRRSKRLLLKSSLASAEGTKAGGGAAGSSQDGCNSDEGSRDGRGPRRGRKRGRRSTRPGATPT